MEEHIKWLQEHKFEFSNIKDEWTRSLDIMGNFKKGDGESVTYEKRLIQTLKITVRHLEQDDIKGWVAFLQIRNGYNLNDTMPEFNAQATNVKTFLSDTPASAIALSANNLGDILVDCLKQVAKLASKQLSLSFTFTGDVE